MGNRISKDVINHLVDKVEGESIICPVCKQDKWSVGEIVFDLHESQLKNYIKEFGSKKKVLPVIDVVCKNCGNVLFISAIIANIITRMDVD